MLHHLKINNKTCKLNLTVGFLLLRGTSCDLRKIELHKTSKTNQKIKLNQQVKHKKYRFKSYHKEIKLGKNLGDIKIKK